MVLFTCTALAPPRRALALLAGVGLLALSGGALAATPAQAVTGLTSLDYSCTGGAQAWVVPAGVTSATFILDGAAGGQGGGNGTSAAGGKGGELQATLAVTPGDSYTLVVGCQGTDRGAGGFNGGGAGGGGSQSSQGGGGGGATDVRHGGSGTADRVLVAGGGGGSSASGFIPAPSQPNPAAAGGKGSGAGGGATAGSDDPGRTGGGQPGTSNAAGPGGTNYLQPGLGHGDSGGAGTGGTGGSSGSVGGGGGGAGWFGGGGGAASGDSQTAGGGGGGGSGHVDAAATLVTTSAGVHSGAGSLTVSFAQPVQQPSAPTITGTPPDGSVGTAYSFPFFVSGSPTCAITSGSLPPGLQLSTTGCGVSGTPTAGGVYPFTVTASNAVEPAATVDATVTIAQLGSLADGVQLQANVGQPFSAQLPLDGYPTPAVTVRPLTPLPAGLTMGEHGLITGTPTSTTRFPLFISLLLDNAAGEAFGGFQIAVGEAPTVPASVTSGDPDDAVAGQPYSFTFTASGSPSPSFRLIDSPLPSGLDLDGTSGVLSGTTSEVGDFPLLLAASNGVGTEDQRSYTLHVTGTGPSITGTPGDGVVGQQYDFGYVLGGNPASTTTVTGGALPSGLELGTDGQLTGVPTTAGTYAFTVTAANAAGSTAIDSTVTITAPAVISGIPGDGLVGQPYDFGYVLSGSPAPTTTVTPGSLPPGLELSADGSLTGVPTTVGRYTFIVTAGNGTGEAATVTSTIVVTSSTTGPALGGTPPSGGVREPYTFTFLSSGSPAPTVTKSAGSLPPGLTLTTAGQLSGTPTTAGTYRFTVRATNGVGTPVTQAVVLGIAPPPRVSIADATTVEGNSGAHALSFTVSLSRPSTAPVSVQWATVNGTAKAGSDYVAGSGQLTFAPGQTSRTITVLVKGDRSRESTETFTVHLAHPGRAQLGDGTATGAIVNDD